MTTRPGLLRDDDRPVAGAGRRDLRVDGTVVVAVLVVAVLVPLPEEPVSGAVRLGVAAAAAVVLADAARRFPAARPAWGRFAVGAALLACHYAVMLVCAADRGHDHLHLTIPLFSAASMLWCGWAAVLMARPVLWHPQTRRIALVALPVCVAGGCSVALADPTIADAGPFALRWVPVACCILGGLVCVAWVVASGPTMVAAGRGADPRVCIGVAVMLVGTGLSRLDYDSLFAVPPLAAIVVVAGATFARGAGAVTTALEVRPLLEPVQYRWVVVAGVPAAALGPLVGMGAPAPVAVFLLALSAVGGAAFWWDLRRARLVRRARPTDRAAAVRGALVDGILGGDMALAFQPIVRVRDRAVVGFEALLRWEHPRLGAVSPAEVLAAARAARTTVDLDLVVLARVHALVVDLRRSADVAPPGDARPYVAANVSPSSLQHPGFVDLLLARLGGDDDRPLDGVVVEIVEEGPVESWELLRANVEALRAAGARMALDDFGTGTSNFRYFNEIRVDVVKLDRSLVVWSVAGRGRSVMTHLLAATRAVGAVVVAEGVEDEETLDLLASIGVDCVQGFLLGRPGPLLLPT